MGFTLERFNDPRRDKRTTAECDRALRRPKHRRSPRFGRTRSTLRQDRLTDRRCRECLCPRSLQVGGGQCGYCGRFTHREAHRNQTGWFAPKIRPAGDVIVDGHHRAEAAHRAGIALVTEPTDL